MKQYVIDELRPGDYERIKGYLDRHYGPADLGNIYWIPMEPVLYDPVQASHGDCHPLCFAVQLSETSLAAELLVRTKNRIRCDCIRYATDDQLLWFNRLLDAILEKLEIST